MHGSSLVCVGNPAFIASAPSHLIAALGCLYCSLQQLHCVGCERVDLVPHCLETGLCSLYKAWAALTLQVGFVRLSQALVM